jgi:hypothetical protein
VIPSHRFPSLGTFQGQLPQPDLLNQIRHAFEPEQPIPSPEAEKTRQLLVSKCRSNPPFFAIEADLLVTPSDSPRRRQE